MPMMCDEEDYNWIQEMVTQEIDKELIEEMMRSTNVKEEKETK